MADPSGKGYIDVESGDEVGGVRKAYEGGGILAPIEAEEFKAFTAETLRYYKDNPAAYRDKCHAIQEAAKRFDWKYTIDEWVDLIEAARRPGESKQQPRGQAAADIDGLSGAEEGRK
jgi:hypothetical protein